MSLKDLFQEEGLDPEKLIIQIIPPNTTYELQPLDRYFFRMYKYMIRELSHNVDFDDPSQSLQQRDNILKLQSLAFQQFLSPRFQHAHQYGWVLAGLATRQEGHFQNTIDYYCFIGLMGHRHNCNKIAIIRCVCARRNYVSHISLLIFIIAVNIFRCKVTV